MRYIMDYVCENGTCGKASINIPNAKDPDMSPSRFEKSMNIFTQTVGMLNKSLRKSKAKVVRRIEE